RPPGEDGYFLLTATPSYEPSGTVLPKDVTFVLDVSGSMSGDKMLQAKRAIRFCLDHLNAADRFDIIRFSTEADALFGELEEASRANVAKAHDYVERLEAIGGTNTEEALTLALRSNASMSSRPKVVIFMTDGKPTIGETDEDRLVRKVRDANVRGLRIFTFGIGEDLNTHFLDKLTEATRAARTYVGEKQDLELPLSAFFEKIKSPVLVDVSVRFGEGMKAFQMYPRDLPDLFKGSELTLFGRYNGAANSVTLDGTVDGRRVSLPYSAAFPSRTDANELIAPLWAAQRVGYLLDQLRLHGDEKELIDEVTRLARRYGVITPYTSYLITEDERARVARNVLSPQNQTLNAMSLSRELTAKIKGEYDAMRQKAGAPSVQASVEVEALKNARNSAQVNQGKKRLDYKDSAGATQNLATQMKNVRGRAVYQVGNNWIDSDVQAARDQTVRRVRFASAEYFDLLNKEPHAADFLALGRNVRFVAGGRIYDVYE
ncbi:MAG TPA: VWA domain-containing protein, partial [Thermoanaerobaculia bacterium]|nr:VWA domain-containing protein [Thermoanaerobaculia bacterium]